MKIRKITLKPFIIGGFVLLLVGVGIPTLYQAQATARVPSALRYEIEPANSSVRWHARKVTGEHYGTVNVGSGYLTIENGQISKGECTVDMTSITVTDIEDAKYNTKLVNHLKSEDFFDVEEHPKATFTLKKLKYNINSEHPEHKYEATGTLTIKGKSHPIVFPASIGMEKGAVQFKGILTFDRSRYDIRYRSGSFFEDLGDKLIYDNVDLTINISARPN